MGVKLMMMCMIKMMMMMMIPGGISAVWDGIG